MKTITKLKTHLIILALTLAICPSLIALEYWRFDKETGFQISPNQCVGGSLAFCATVYENGSDTPIVAIYGHFLDNP